MTEIPVEITFRDLAPSPAIEANIREHVDKLATFNDRISACRVLVEAPHRHHQKGKLYHVKLELSVPGTNVMVTRDRERDHGHEDVYVAIRDAFDAARRQLQEDARIRRGAVKTHAKNRRPTEPDSE